MINRFDPSSRRRRYDSASSDYSGYSIEFLNNEDLVIALIFKTRELQLDFWEFAYLNILKSTYKRLENRNNKGYKPTKIKL